MSQVLAFKRRATPTSKNGTVGVAMPPLRRKNAEIRKREYLTESEVEKLIKAVRNDKGRRQPERDEAMILIAYGHGLRVSELLNLRWSDVDLKRCTLNVQRLKGSISGVHPLTGKQVRALRAVRGEDPGEFVFTTERGGPMTPAGFRKLLARLGDAVPELRSLAIHPHMLRHGCGYKLANASNDTRLIQGFLGHASITNTVQYTALDVTRYKGMWKD